MKNPRPIRMTGLFGKRPGGRPVLPAGRKVAAGRIGLREFGAGCAAVLLLALPLLLRADQIQMQNGDHYSGRVVSLDTNTLVLRSEVLGTVRLPRGKVALITFDAGAVTNAARVVSVTNGQSGASVPLTNGTVDLSGPLRQLGANTNFIRQVQAQFLADAGPDANNKFNAMVGGLLSGKLTMDDIRTEAKSAADQLKELKRDLGGDDGGELDGYLAILENFLRESAPPKVALTNAANAPLKQKPGIVPGK